MLAIPTRPDYAFHWLKGPFPEDRLEEVLAIWADEFGIIGDCVEFWYEGIHDGCNITGSFMINEAGCLN